MNTQPHTSIKGQLFKEMARTREKALRIGALLPIPTDYEYIQDGGVRFLVRILSRLAQKDQERKKQIATPSGPAPAQNPFLPYEKDLYVSDLSESHVALLNKYNVMDNHLLIVTRDFEHQETLLTLKDFEALCICLAEFEGLGFYNGGVEAGASQPHKHLQVVPLPIDPGGPAIPVEPLMQDALKRRGVTHINGFPFLNAFCPIELDTPASVGVHAGACFDAYARLLVASGLTAPSWSSLIRQSRPYCLLVTSKWMFLVPRACEHFNGISINALGFAGSFFLRSREEYDSLRKTGPMMALAHVSLPSTRLP